MKRNDSKSNITEAAQKEKPQSELKSKSIYKIKQTTI